MINRPLSRALSFLLSTAVCLLLSAVAASAQSATATLSGIVQDANGAVVPGTSITITNVATTPKREATTNTEGSFTAPLLPPGTYTLRAERDGFAPVQVENVVLNVGDQKALEIQLKTGDVKAEVQVINEAPLINESPAVATTIDRQFVGNLPLNGRSFQSLILLTPGVVPTVATNSANPGQFSVNGQRTNANYFTVDGVSANIEANLASTSTIAGQGLAGSLPGLSSLGTTNTLISVDALEEFKIQTSTYSAEFGRQPGGQVQLVSRSGGNGFHGSLFEYLRNDAFDANNWFNNANRIRKPPMRHNQFGGTFSGPVFVPKFGEGGENWYNGKDRTFFFLSYEGLRLRLPTTVNVDVPSLRLRQIAAPGFKPLLNAYPLPTGPEEIDSNGLPTGGAPFVAAYSSPKSTDATSIRFDRLFGSRFTLFGRYNEASSDNATRTLNRLSGGLTTTRTLTLGSTALFSPQLSNEFRFNISTNRGRVHSAMDDFGGAVPVDLSALVSGYDGPGVKMGQLYLFFFLPNPTDLVLGDAVDSYQRQINVVDNISYTTGTHRIRLGFDYRHLAPTFGPTAYSEEILPFSQDDIINGIADVFLSARQEVRPRFNNYSLYAQDEWRVNSRLKLDLGLRWEINPPPRDANGREPVMVMGVNGTDVSNATLAPPGTPLYKTFYRALAPRFGAAYRLNKKSGREIVLRGGFGVYYDLGNGQALNGFSSFPFEAFADLGVVPFPITPAQARPPSFPAVTLPLCCGSYAVNPDLKLPYTLQWTLAVDQSLGNNQVLSLSYVASAGRRLLTTQRLNRRVRNTGPYPNPNFRGDINYITNGPTSDYHSMQVQFQRRLSRGLQALVNYTWSHAIDVASDEVTTGLFERGNASFDVRNNFSAGVTYNLPNIKSNPIANGVLRNWSIDSTIYAQSGQPLNIAVGSLALGNGTHVRVRPDLVSGEPIWISDPTLPGGRRINPAAFSKPPFLPGSTCGDCYSRQGTLGRNVVIGPAKYQVNLGLRREFMFSERWRLQLKGEAFNIFNHPLFGSFNTIVGNSNFGKATETLNSALGGLNSLYQLGGPRSLQFSVRLGF